MNEIMRADVTGLPLEQLGSEVRLLTRQARSMVLGYGVEIGRRLAAAKDKVPYGQWGAWVEEETDFSQSTAGRFIKLFEEYGAAQGSLFGAEVESSTLTKVSVSNALRLLAIPAEEREAFASEVDAEHLSTRALEEAIEERRKAEARAAEAEGSLAATEDRLSEMEEELEHRDRALSRAVEALTEAEARAAESLRKKLQAASSGAGTAAVYAQIAQENFAKALGTIAAMDDRETAQKLKDGMADILRSLLARVEEA